MAKKGSIVLSNSEEITKLREYLRSNGIKFETSGYFDNGTYFAIWGMSDEEYTALEKFVEEEL